MSGLRSRALPAAVLVVAALGQVAAHPPPGERPIIDAAPDFNVPAAQLRVALGTALAEHAFLLSEAMRAGVGEAEGFGEVGAALEENSVELIDMIADVYGEAAGSQFGDLWRSHVAYLIDYTRALAADDTAAQAIASEQLHTYVGDFSAFLASANPNLPADVVEELIGEHVQQLEVVAAFDERDYDTAYATLREIHAHMYTVGDALSEAIALQFPDLFPGRSLAFSPAGDLRVALNRLLCEHTALAVTSMRAGLSDPPDAAAAQTALEANTADLGVAVADVYGEAAGDAFVELWTTHTDAYLDYVTSAVEGDSAGRTAALEELTTYRIDFSDFLADANPELSPRQLRSLLEHHTSQLIDQVDAFVERDYAAAYGTAREAFAHSREMADALALAIAAQFPDRFPDARQREGIREPGGFAAIGLGLLALAVATVIHRRNRNGRERARSPGV